MMEVLSRSIIGETLKPFDVVSVEMKIKKEVTSVSSVKDMGPYKALVSFISKDAMEECLKCSKQPLLEFFDEVRDWTPEEICQT